ncbi:MAG: heparinase II/III family protein, partial [Planctomycetota bacterium]|nr:heparinase II/III family protein [Planctomycetota bacterium]
VWTVPRGQTSTLSLSQEAASLKRLRYFDRLLFDYRITSGRIQFLFNVDAFGHRSGPRQAKVHQWHIGLPTTARDQWHVMQIVFDVPAWLPWNSKDGQEHETFLNMEIGAGAEDLVVELREMKLVPDYLFLKPWWISPVTFPRRTEDGYEVKYPLANLGPGERKVNVSVRSSHQAFEVTVDPTQVEIAPFKTQTFTVRAKQKAAGLPELTKEDLILAFIPDDEPEAAYLATSRLTKPLKKDYRRQVIYSQNELSLLKEMLGRKEGRQWLQFDRRKKNADWFLDVKLDAIPGERAWAHPGYGGDVCANENCDGRMSVTTIMPAVKCSKCGKHELGTPKAAIAWKLWMGSSTSGRGGLDDLGVVYLLTGDEKYARKAIELFLLYSEQYEKLPWTEMHNDVPFFRGNYLLAASRIAHGSTYGTNFLLKGHFRLLNMISESPSWTEEARGKVHEGFVIPAAAELAKFPGGLFNMTDLTNYDLILAGLSCGDANILHRGLAYDSGLMKRLTDIKPDGFSSEGRPLNYHYSSMNEYIHAVPLVRNSGLAIDFPYDLLKAALRMPYERATLSGYVPVTGDNGCGMSVHPSPLCDVVYDLFPNEEWLYQAGARSTPHTFLKSLKEKPPEKDAWKKAIKTEPTLFPQAGFAILRSGNVPEEQVYLTLDYGENPMHAALDRLQITLWAFGHCFTQGPGSNYNAPSNFERGHEKAMAFISHDSLGNNVVMVDGANQSPAIGQLIAWAPELKTDAGLCQGVAAEVEGHYPDVTHRRAVFLIRGTVVILDDLSSNRTHTYDFVYHNFGKLSPGKGWKFQETSKPLGDKANYPNIRNLQRVTGSGDLRLLWKLPNKLSLDFWHAGTEGEIYTGLTGMNNGETRKVGEDTPSVFIRSRGESRRFSSVLQPLKGKSQVASIKPLDHRKEVGVEIRFTDGKTATLLFKPRLTGLQALSTR